ncbi:MAG: MarR family transcriptional regulator [Elusimicrobiota bacterium]|nr:MarR family transcriptional regulator [Elusimicrobiota bacterium]
MRLTKRQEDVLRFLRDKGRARTPDIEAAFGFTRARAGQIIKPLVDAGLVIREGQTRATTYRLA